MHKIKKFFKDVTFYLTSNLFSNSLGLITGIVIRRILQPVLMGLFNEIMLVFEYARFSHLGIIHALDREMPYFYGKKDYEKVERVKNVGFSLCLMVVLLVSTGIFISTFIIKFSNDKLLLNGIRIVSLMVVLRLIGSLYIVLNRSRNRFSVISKYRILFAVFDITFKVFLIIRFGLYGLLWASVLTLIMVLIYFYRASGEKFKFVLDFSFEEVASLFKIGFPLIILGFVSITLLNIDRIMIIRLLDREKLGFYTIALMVSVYVIQLPNMIYGVFFPRFYQAYGEKQNIFEIKDLFIKPTVIFAYFFPVLIGLVILGLPLLVNYVLPSYMPGLLPAYILLLGSSFVSLVHMPEYLLTALNKQIYMVVIAAFAIIIAATLNYIFVKEFHFGLKGIALGTSITYFLYITTLMVCAFRNYTKKLSSHVKFFVELYFPFVWVLMFLLILQGFTFNVSGNFFKDFSIVFYKGLVFLLGCLPLILYANKKTAILTLIRKMYFLKGKAGQVS